MTEDSEIDSDNELRRAAAASVADVDALNLEGEDRSIVLKALLQARLGDSTAIAVPPRGGGSASVASKAAVTHQPDSGDVLGRVAQVLQVEREALDMVYAVEDGEPALVVSAKKIATNKSAGARELAQLVAAARQAAGIEEWTSASTIRAVVSEYGRLDSNNFASSIQAMDNIAVLKGKGLQREIKITRPGLESTADFIRSIAGGE